MTTKNLIKERRIYYSELLNQLTEQCAMPFHEVQEIELSGVYFVYQNQTLLYVGMTKRSLKFRLSEMATGYNLHPLNRKLLYSLMLRMNGNEIQALRKTNPEDLVKRGILTQSKFEFLQTCVNVRVKNNFSFKFLELPKEEAIELKTLAIEMLKPKMNAEAANKAAS